MRLLHPEVPFAPRRAPFFYGWVVLGASTLGVIMSIPGQTMGVSVFTDALVEATGLSRLGLSYTYMLGTLMSGVLLPKGGRLLDRFGTRVTVLGAAAGLGLTLLALSQIDHVAETAIGLLPAIDPALLTAAVMALVFTALRFSGQGMMTMVSRTMLGKWFNRRRGLTSAISGVFVAAAFALAPLALNAWIEAATWRGAWAGMAATVGLGMGGLGWLLFRDDPEQCGLRMDGDVHDEQPAEEHTATRAEALSTTAFWALTLTLAVQALVITGFTFHILDLGETVGLSNAEVVSFFVPMAVFSTTTGVVVGWAADRTQIRTLIFLMLLAELVGYAGSANLGSTAGFWVAVMGMGVASGFFSPLASVALPRLFGRTHLGAIAGVQTMAVVVGSALGPPAFALSASLTGSYATGLYACLALPLIVIALNTLARHEHDVPPTRPSE